MSTDKNCPRCVSGELLLQAADTLDEVARAAEREGRIYLQLEAPAEIAHLDIMPLSVARGFADLLRSLADDYRYGGIDGDTADSALAVARTVLGERTKA